jgi:3-deoxy-7-phosphoheptulonate synthase
MSLIVVMKADSSEEAIARVSARLQTLGFGVHLSRGERQTVIGAIGDKSVLAGVDLEAMEGVEKVVPIRQPFKLVSREFHPETTVVDVGGVAVGGAEVVVIAGPCSVETREQLVATARAVKAAGARLLRGGAFKPRTSPYGFRGLGEEGLHLLADVRAEIGLPIVTEVMSPEAVALVERYADCLQIGARNMQNYDLLREVGRTRKPVLLKRGLAATIQEWLMAAEYLLAGGNYQVILCERGIRTFEPATRFTMDINAVPVAQELSHLPVIVDPSHGTGRAALVPALARAAVAAGADGLIMEVHPNPAEALSDGAQTLSFGAFAETMVGVARVAAAVDRVCGADRPLAARA